MKAISRSAAAAATIVSLLACSTDKEGTPPGSGLDSGLSGVVTAPDAGGGATGGANATPDSGGSTPTPGGTGGMGGTVARDASADSALIDAGASVPDGALAGDAAALGDGALAGDAGAFASCVAALKPCTYDEKESSCSSVKTPVIPLTNGMKWGDTVLPQGPHGSYVEWNEGMAFANPVNIGESTCELLAPLAFQEPDAVTADVLNLRGQDLALYTVFRPACMRDGEKYPVITWGNGTCGQSGGYAGLLATLASHGFVVFAANSRFTDAGNNEMLKALDFAKAANEDPKNPLFGRLDLSKVGAMGHSQGAGATGHAAPDPRIKAIILWNGGDDIAVTKPFLTVSGDRDTNSRTAMQLSTKVNASTQPAAWLYYHKVLETGGLFTGHLTLMMQPERVSEATIAWWKYILNGDAEAKKMFAGSDCGLCGKAADFEFGQENIQ